MKELKRERITLSLRKQQRQEEFYYVLIDRAKADYLSGLREVETSERILSSKLLLRR